MAATFAEVISKLRTKVEELSKIQIDGIKDLVDVLESLVDLLEDTFTTVGSDSEYLQVKDPNTYILNKLLEETKVTNKWLGKIYNPE